MTSSGSIAERLYGDVPTGSELFIHHNVRPEPDDVVLTLTIHIRRCDITEEEADALIFELEELDYETEIDDD